jgi:molybdenum-dependent DNA-binding transcriptional regulator ModE
VETDVAQGDAELASDLIASRTTTQPIETVIAILAARRSGATINAAARAAGINYRTAQRIAEAAEERRQTDLVAAS